MSFIRGRRGPVIFFERYNKQFVKIYTKPSNPQTSEQQDHRYYFRFINKLWNFLNFNIFYLIWNTASEIFNPHNIFIKNNQNQFSKELDFNSVIISDGKLEPVSEIVFIKYKDIAGRCMFKWKTDILSNGKPTDKILLTLVYFKNYLPGKNIFNFDIYIDQSKIRSDSVGFILPPKDLDINFLYGFISTFTDPIIDKNNASISLGKTVISF